MRSPLRSPLRSPIHLGQSETQRLLAENRAITERHGRERFIQRHNADEDLSTLLAPPLVKETPADECYPEATIDAAPAASAPMDTSTSDAEPMATSADEPMTTAEEEEADPPADEPMLDEVEVEVEVEAQIEVPDVDVACEECNK
eukprot:5979016-Prymnesium_polylepis.2